MKYLITANFKKLCRRLLCPAALLVPLYNLWKLLLMYLNARPAGHNYFISSHLYFLSFYGVVCAAVWGAYLGFDDRQSHLFPGLTLALKRKPAILQGTLSLGVFLAAFAAALFVLLCVCALFIGERIYLGLSLLQLVVVILFLWSWGIVAMAVSFVTRSLSGGILTVLAFNYVLSMLHGMLPKALLHLSLLYSQKGVLARVFDNAVNAQGSMFGIPFYHHNFAWSLAASIGYLLLLLLLLLLYAEKVELND